VRVTLFVYADDYIPMLEMMNSLNQQDLERRQRTSMPVKGTAISKLVTQKPTVLTTQTTTRSHDNEIAETDAIILGQDSIENAGQEYVPDIIQLAPVTATQVELSSVLMNLGWTPETVQNMTGIQQPLFPSVESTIEANNRMLALIAQEASFLEFTDPALWKKLFPRQAVSA
jgi:hypothetical protein